MLICQFASIAYCNLIYTLVLDELQISHNTYWFKFCQLIGYIPIFIYRNCAIINHSMLSVPYHFMTQSFTTILNRFLKVNLFPLRIGVSNSAWKDVFEDILLN